MGTRVHLCGRLAVSGEAATVDEHELPGRQGRLALALLCLERRRPVSVDRLIEALWEGPAPPDASGALASIVSKLRTELRRAAGDGPGIIAAGAGTYQLRLGPGSSVDAEDARSAIDRAEGARRTHEAALAWSHATVAATIARRGILAGETADWVLVTQREVERIARRAYACLAWVWTVRGDGELAIAMAESALALEPLYEPSWRDLMAIQARFGSRADAVRSFRRCRNMLRDELGVFPDPETSRLYERLLTD